MPALRRSPLGAGAARRHLPRRHHPADDRRDLLHVLLRHHLRTHLQDHARRRTDDRRRRLEEPLRTHRRRGRKPPLRLAHPPDLRPRHAGRPTRHAGPQTQALEPRDAGAGRPVPPDEGPDEVPRRTARPADGQSGPAPPPRHHPLPEHPESRAPQGHPAQLPLPLVPALHRLPARSGHRSPRRAHLDHALPHGRALEGDQRPRQCRPKRQAGLRVRRTQGPLRRGAEHRAYRPAATRGREGHLRHRGPEGALQDRTRRTARILRTARIRLHRDGQFQREYSGDLRRLRSADRPQGDRRRCPQRVPVSHEQPQAVQVQAPARIALLHARGVRRTDRPRDAQRPQGTQGLYLRQMQLTDRRTDHRPPLPGQPGRRRGTADRPRSLLPAPLGRGHERADPGHQHRGQVPRARPALHLLQRRRRTDLHRVGRLDVAQPRPPGRGLHADPRPADPAPPAQGLRHPVVGQREGTRPCGPGGQSPSETRSGTVSRTQPDGAVRLLQGTKRKGEKSEKEKNEKER